MSKTRNWVAVAAHQRRSERFSGRHFKTRGGGTSWLDLYEDTEQEEEAYDDSARDSSDCRCAGDSGGPEEAVTN